ncbi:MAG: PDZ domain-containing protein [Firmicutes bacterium]|nr:PDZ domain-containing protein [Candidatus Fermentithermobacillaceae bacterium]
MGAFSDLVKAVIRSYGQLLLDPVTGLLFLIVVTIVGTQYVRIEVSEKKSFGYAFNKALPQMVKSMAFGLLGGLLSSVLVVLIGVSLTDSGVQYVLPTALALYLINPRFLCFSYAGGILSVLHLVTGWPRVNVPVITGLVACLHAVESLLIRLSGATCASPVVLKRKEGDVVGGFVLQRFWPVPLILLALTTVPEGSVLPGDVITLPDWWPLLRAPIPEGPGVPIFVMTPIMAGLGYSDLALTTTPEKRSRETSRALAVYSVTLLGLSILSSRLAPLRWVAALFAPAAHEFVIWMGVRKEREGKPYYVSAEGVGATILEVVPGSEASRAGLKRGNVITSISGAVVTRESLASLRQINEVVLEVATSPEDPRRTTVHLTRQGDAPFGFFTAPMPGDQPLVELGRQSPLVGFIKRILRRSR